MKTPSFIPGFVALLITACALTPAQQQQINALATAVAPLVQSYAQNGHVSYAQAIPTALNSIAVFDPTAAVDITALEPLIENTIAAFTNNTSGSTGQKIAATVLAALPANPTGSQVNAALTQAGVGASNGANP